MEANDEEKAAEKKELAILKEEVENLKDAKNALYEKLGEARSKMVTLRKDHWELAKEASGEAKEEIKAKLRALM